MTNWRGRALNTKIDITEVARQAGVSTATVSRVINDSPLVKAETREKVEKVLKSTKYRVNAAAKQLRTSKSYNIGMIYTSLLMNFYNTDLHGGRRGCEEERVQCFLLQQRG
jgi:LacI family transcriptional regulator